MSICDKPFDNNFSRFNDISGIPNYENAKNYIDQYNSQCLMPKIDYVSEDIKKYMNQYKHDKDELITAEQTNNDTKNLYTNDFYYVTIKGIIYFVIMAIFIYFFGISNLINRIKITGTVLKDKAVVIKDKAIELKDKIKVATEPKLS